MTRDTPQQGKIPARKINKASQEGEAPLLKLSRSSSKTWRRPMKSEKRAKCLRRNPWLFNKILSVWDKRWKESFDRKKDLLVEKFPAFVSLSLLFRFVWAKGKKEAAFGFGFGFGFSFYFHLSSEVGYQSLIAPDSRCAFSFPIAARIRPRNGGEGLSGLVWNSGWNCVATKYGWPSKRKKERKKER